MTEYLSPEDAAFFGELDRRATNRERFAQLLAEHGMEPRVVDDCHVPWCEGLEGDHERGSTPLHTGPSDLYRGVGDGRYVRAGDGPTLYRLDYMHGEFLDAEGEPIDGLDASGLRGLAVQLRDAANRLEQNAAALEAAGTDDAALWRSIVATPDDRH